MISTIGLRACNLRICWKNYDFIKGNFFENDFRGMIYSPPPPLDRFDPHILHQQWLIWFMHRESKLLTNMTSGHVLVR